MKDLKASERAKRYRMKNIRMMRIKEKEKSRLYRLNNREKYLQQQREYRKNNPEKYKQYYLNGREKAKISARKRRIESYGITVEAYNEILLKQEGKCAICKIYFENLTPHIDHSHESGEVRGLLCSPCNIVLGYMEKIIKRNSNIFEEITEYLNNGSTKRLRWIEIFYPSMGSNKIEKSQRTL